MVFEGANTLTIIKDKRSKISVEVNPGLLWHSAPSVKKLNMLMKAGNATKLMALGDGGMGFFSNPMYSFQVKSVK
jgi:hypothetical protein